MLYRFFNRSKRPSIAYAVYQCCVLRANTGDTTDDLAGIAQVRVKRDNAHPVRRAVNTDAVTVTARCVVVPYPHIHYSHILR